MSVGHFKQYRIQRRGRVWSRIREASGRGWVVTDGDVLGRVMVVIWNVDVGRCDTRDHQWSCSAQPPPSSSLDARWGEPTNFNALRRLSGQRRASNAFSSSAACIISGEVFDRREPARTYVQLQSELDLNPIRPWSVKMRGSSHKLLPLMCKKTSSEFSVTTILHIHSSLPYHGQRNVVLHQVNY